MAGHDTHCSGLLSFLSRGSQSTFALQRQTRCYEQSTATFSRAGCILSMLRSQQLVPEAAVSLMEAMTGLSLDRIWISRHIRSLASASPPGESTLRTTALMFCGNARVLSEIWRHQPHRHLTGLAYAGSRLAVVDFAACHAFRPSPVMDNLADALAFVGLSMTPA